MQHIAPARNILKMSTLQLHLLDAFVAKLISNNALRTHNMLVCVTCIDFLLNQPQATVNFKQRILVRAASRADVMVRRSPLHVKEKEQREQ
jgi:hypothetical protein